MSQPTDELFDAIDPIRRLATGPDALISANEYATYRNSTARVMARVAPIASTSPWAFFAVRSTTDGAPRWMFIDPESKTSHTNLNEVVERVRGHLEEHPPNQGLDDTAARWLAVCLDQATKAEVELLPRRMRRALQQMHTVTTAWQHQFQHAGDEPTAARWGAIAGATTPSADQTAPDAVALAERWIELITPVLEQHQAENPRRRYVLIDDITSRLTKNPFDIGETESALYGIPESLPLASRVSACILGVPAKVG